VPRTVKTANLDETALATCLETQDQVISRAQALARGLTAGALRHRLAPGGPWQRILPGVYLTVTGAPAQAQRDVAAFLYAGPGAVLTGSAALRRQGIRAPADDLVTVLVPARRVVRNVAFVRIWRTARMPETVLSDRAVRCALPPRAVADAARALTSLSEARELVAGAVQTGRCPVLLLADEVAAAPRRGGALLRAVCAEVEEGVRSVAEAEFRDLLRRARLPMPMFNARLYDGHKLIAVADAWWPDAGLVAEVDSREWHLLPSDWQRTLRRDAALTAHGILVVHVTPSQVREDPATVVAEIRAAIAAGQARGPVAVRALPATG
jgi:very-short-patch-repair endonuclease